MNTSITVQCAWCGSVKISGRYSALGLIALVDQIDLPGTNGQKVHHEVSHGICERCKEKLIGYDGAARSASLSAA